MRSCTHLPHSGRPHAGAPDTGDAANSFAERETTAGPARSEAPSASVTEGDGVATTWPEIDACRSFDAAEYFRDRRLGDRWLYGIAYPALLALHRGGDAAFDYAVQQLPSESRKRKPSRRHPEVLALTLATKPTELFQRKMCSAYGAVLLVGHNHGFDTPEFVEWAVEADVEECRARAAAIRARRRAVSGPSIDTGDDPIWLTISCGVGRTVAAKYRTRVPPDVARAITALLQRPGAPA